MHPMERLRHVARATGAAPGVLAEEAARALRAFGDDPAGLVIACRRLIERHPEAGPVWWMAARVLCASDAGAEAAQAVRELEEDATPTTLARRLIDHDAVLTVGWGEQTDAAVGLATPREVLVVETAEGLPPAVARSDATVVPVWGVAGAVDASTVVVLEALAMGATGFVAPAGSRAAAAVAGQAGVPVWLCAGAGRVLPGRLWETLCQRLHGSDEAWMSPFEVVGLDLVAEVVGPGGWQLPADALRRADCPIPSELLR